MKNTLTALGLLCALSTSALAQDIEPGFETFHKGLLTLDTHTDISPNVATDLIDPSMLTQNQVDLVKLEKGGLDAVFFIAFSRQQALSDEGLQKARKEALSRLLSLIHI